MTKLGDKAEIAPTAGFRPVLCDPTSDNVRLGDADYGYLGLADGVEQTGSFTAVAGYLYPVSIASLGANADVTFPAAPSAGDTFGLFIKTENTTDTGTSGFAQAPFWGVEPVATTSIRGESYSHAAADGVAKWGLMLDGESLVFRYDGATWQVILDGRIPHCFSFLDSWTHTSSGAYVAVDLGGVADEEIDNAGCKDATGDVYDVKRSGSYNSLLQVENNISNEANKLQIEIRGSAATTSPIGTSDVQNGNGTTSLALISYAAGETISGHVYQNDSASESLKSMFSIQELLS